VREARPWAVGRNPFGVKSGRKFLHGVSLRGKIRLLPVKSFVYSEKSHFGDFSLETTANKEFLTDFSFNATEFVLH
jgi:hypothetical protein